LSREVARLGGEPLALVCDVSDAGQVKRAVADTLARFHRIDLALLSAGIGKPEDALNFKAAKVVEMTATNLFGVAFCLEELIPAMQSQQGGTIAVLSSLAADRGFPGSGGYCATKAALNSLCDAMRAQLATANIRLVTIAPGFVRTPMTAQNGRMPFLMEADAAAKLILRRIERGDKIIRFPLPTSLATRFARALPAFVYDRLIGKRQPIPKGQKKAVRTKG
jgi:NAD(P)-dependent dehydrogenase (short-subunit alcohol dehydrogenase family)